MKKGSLQERPSIKIQITLKTKKAQTEGLCFFI